MATKYPIQEIPFEKLTEESFDCTEPTIYAVLKEGVRFEFLVKRERDAARAAVFGTGNLTIPREDWPYYSRHSWMNSLPYSCIYYFDPTLYLGPVHLAWCYGTNDRWYLREIADILKIILERIGILPENTLMMGSSGGGFTSIMLATMLRTRCQAINPQFDFRRYKAQAVESLKSVVLRPGEDWIEERASAVAFMLSENYIPKMHILQNILVEEDIEDHILPMVSNLCLAQAHCGYDRIRLDFYHHIDGHNGMPPKGKCLEYIQQDLEAPFPDDPEAQELMCDAAYLLSGKNLTVRLKAGHAPQESAEYAYYLYRGNQVVEKTGYSRDTEKTYCDLLPGRYRVKYFVRIGQLKRSFTMGSITVS